MGEREIRMAYDAAEIVLVLPEGELTLSPGLGSDALDALLGERGAETWTFLSFLAPHRKRRSARKAARRARRAGGWLEGSTRLEGVLRLHGGDELPGVLVLDLPRRRSRELARKLGLRFFYWGTGGSPVELHPVQILDQDPIGGGDMFAAAGAGIRELSLSVLELVQGPLLKRVTRAHAQRLALFGLALLVVASLVHLAALWLVEAEVAGAGLLRFLVHPGVLPAVLLGLALRRHLPSLRPAEAGRELAQEQMVDAWRSLRPGLAGIWILAVGAVLQLALPRFAIGGVESVAGMGKDLLWWLMVCLWLLPAIATARGRDDAGNRLMEAFMALLVTWFLLGLALGFVQFGAGLLLRVAGVDLLASLLAEVALLALALGLTWIKHRERVVLWTSDELPDGK